jgi:hypothetical protein
VSLKVELPGVRGECLVARLPARGRLEGARHIYSLLQMRLRLMRRLQDRSRQPLVRPCVDQLVSAMRSGAAPDFRVGSNYTHFTSDLNSYTLQLLACAVKPVPWTATPLTRLHTRATFAPHDVLVASGTGAPHILRPVIEHGTCLADVGCFYRCVVAACARLGNWLSRCEPDCRPRRCKAH